MDGWLIALGLFTLYIGFVVWLVQSGRLAKWNLSLMLGFILMVRTQRGRDTIDWISRPRRFWNAFGDLGTVTAVLGMVLMTLVFAWTAFFTLRPDSEVQPLGASEVLVIPGVNPFVPLWYGIAALILTLIVHEGGHGILARANGMRVRSLGLLMAVIPIGAFVEPDEEDLKASSRRQRLRVFAAGPMLNIVLALLMLGAFGAALGNVTPVDGAAIAQIIPDGPADLAGVEPGDVFVLLNGMAVVDQEDFRAAMEGTKPGDQVAVGMRDGGTTVVTLTSRWALLTEAQQEQVAREDPENATRMQEEGFMGIVLFDQGRTSFLFHPFASGLSFLQFVSLPIGEVQGAPFLSVYLPTFFEAPFEPAVFWPVVTLVFWIFWINLMVGLTNILPMLPLDGGHIFRDVAGGFLTRIRPGMRAEAREKAIRVTSGTLSIAILVTFLLQIFGPRLF